MSLASRVTIATVLSLASAASVLAGDEGIIIRNNERTLEQTQKRGGRKQR